MPQGIVSSNLTASALMFTSSFGILFVLAFVMSMEFGQTAVEITRQGTRYGLNNALLVSFGAFVAEILFLALTVTGIIFLFGDPQFLKYVWLAGGLIVMFLGVQGIRHYKKAVLVDEHANDTFDGRPFINGLALNFLHPLNIVWWSGTLGPIVLQSSHDNGFLTAALDGLGVPVGGLAWWLLLAFTTAWLKRSFSDPLIRKLNLLSSLGLIVFGAYFLGKAVQLFFF